MTEKTISDTSFSNTLTCNNCGHIDEGVFCSSCGSHLKKKRISVAGLIASIVDFFCNFEDKYIGTFIALLLRPVDFISGYIQGVRDQYYIPFKYFFLNLSINFFIYTYFNLSEITENELDIEVDQLLQLKSEIAFDYLINNYGNLFSLMIIPIYVIFARLIFPKSPYNFAEIATAITFMLGQLMVLEVFVNIGSAIYNPFYFMQKYIIMLAELGIIFTLSYKFFKAGLVHAIWKSALIACGIFLSMEYILILTQNILHLIYGE